MSDVASDNGGAAVADEPSPPRPSARRRPKKRGGGGSALGAVLWAVIKAVVVVLFLQFCAVNVHILMAHFVGEGDNDGAAALAVEGNATEGRAADAVMSDAASAAAAADGGRSGEAAESSNPQDATVKVEPPEKKKKKPRKPKKPKVKKPPKKPREPKPKPPPIIRKVEVIKEVKKSRKLTSLTTEQAALLDEEERKWSEEMVTLQNLARRLDKKDDGSDPLVDVATTLGPEAIAIARFSVDLDKSLQEVKGLRHKLDTLVTPRAARTKQLLREAVDQYDAGAKSWMDAASASRVVRDVKLGRSEHFLGELDSLLRLGFLGNLTSEEVGSKFDRAMREVDALANRVPGDANGEWVWDATADLGAVAERVGFEEVSSSPGEECDTESLVRDDLPPLPHVPDGEDAPVAAVDDVEEEDEDEDDDDDDAMDDEDDEYYADAARESDLFTLIGAVESVLRDRVGRYDVTDADDSDEPVSPLSTTEGESRFFDALDELAESSRDEVDDMRREAEGNALAREGGSKACVDEDDLEELVKGGLEALYRGRDLTEVLTEIVRDMYDDPEQRDSISLDDAKVREMRDFHIDAASLPSSPLAGGGASMDEAMLRRVADDPLLARLLQGLDHVVEASVGHFDPVDTIVDVLSGEDHDGSVGKTLERALRMGLGKVKFPKKMVETREKAGILFDRV